MQRIYCHFAMMFYCLCAFFFLPASSLAISALLSSVVCLCLSVYFNRRPVTLFLIACYSLLGVFFPEYLLFLSLFIGETQRMKLLPAALLPACSLAVRYPPLDFFQLARRPSPPREISPCRKSAIS